MARGAQHKGRSDKQRGFFIREDIYLSDACQCLTPAQRVIYFELRRRFKKNKHKGTNNNGEISLSIRESMRIGNISNPTAQAAFAKLEEVGLIKLNVKGRFRNMNASTFILTDEHVDNKAPTNEWRLYRRPPRKKRCKKI